MLFLILREQRAKVRACTRPWRLPLNHEKLAERVSHGLGCFDEI